MRDEAHDNLVVAADAIGALFRGEDSVEATAGAMLVAEGLHILRIVHTKR